MRPRFAIAALFGAGLFLGPVNAAAQAFDMVCAMEYRFRDSADDPVERRTEEWRIRVDPQAGQFCMATCTGLFPIGASESASSLDLSHANTDRSGQTWTTELVLNRITGELRYNERYSGGDAQAFQRGTGQCRREPFSGFPEAMF